MVDRHAALRDQLFAQVLQGAGESDPSLRQAAAENRDLPDDLGALIAKVHAHAYKVTDADIAQLQAVYGDDKLFEIIVSAALGASRRRLMAGLNALANAEATP
jgi:predicted RNA polymerase sigma factor